jgi:uncharacterized damage-inducible protein DinB
MIDVVKGLFEYDGWASARSLASLKSAARQNPEAARFLAHLLVAEKVWLMRLRGEDTFGVELAPELSPDECEKLADENRRAFSAYLAGLTGDMLDSAVTYRNSKGAEFRTKVVDILLQLVLHGAYHRGQVASALRAGGDVPVNTDYITFVREG